MSSHKAIIVAAGRGRRLDNNTNEIPKCMVPVAGRPIMHWQLNAFVGAGVREVVAVRGYRGDRIDPGATPVRFVDNHDWANNNILASLLCAAAEMRGGFLFSYCDIVYAPSVVARLVAAATAADAAPVSLIIDRRWADAYEGRDLHPVSEAELARVGELNGHPAVLRVGKGAVPREAAVGEFIGLAHFSAEAAEALQKVWEKAVHEGGLEAPFGRAPKLRQAYLTDALNALADQGMRLHPVFIDGEWREIDTPQDLASATRAAHLWSA